MRKTWSQLLSDEDSIGQIRHWVRSAPSAELLPVDPDECRRALEALQMTTRSHLGALTFHSGGLLVRHRWLRVLASGCARLPRGVVNTRDELHELYHPAGIVVADDAAGGFFSWFDEPRTVHYFAPDARQWKDTGLDYGDWLQWALSDQLEAFYERLSWPGWEQDVARLAPDCAYATGTPGRRPTPVLELWTPICDLEFDFPEPTPPLRS